MSKAVGFFKNIILTNKGKELLLSSNNNIDNSLEFTICKFGDGRYTEEEALTATDIKNAWKTQNLNTVRIDNSEDVPKLIIEITFSNKDMQEPKVLNELGIFAKDKQNETHLFAYSLSNIENGEEIEIENDYPTTFKISIISKISNNTNVTNIIDPNGFLTKEVIELLKENIRNIAFRKIRGTLNAGERTITISTDNLMPLSNRLVLNIEGEIYFLDRDYTIDTKSNTITLKEPYSFDKDSMYEIIDPLPATYVKEQINEFIEDFKQLVSNSKVDFNEFKEQLKLEIQNKIDEFYNNLDSYIEQNRENLKGLSIKEIVANGTDENGGNKYNVVREDNTVIGEIIAPKGIQGNGIIDVEFVGFTENGDTEYKLILDNGNKTEHTFISPKGQKGEPFRIVKVYRSILEMQADLNNPEIHVGDMVAIDTGSVEDEDTGKLFVRTNEEFSYLLDLSGATGIQGPEGPEGPKGRDGKDGLSIKEVVPNGTDENGDNKYNIVREDNTIIGEIVSPAYGKDKVSKSGDTMTGTLYINGVSNGLEIVDGINNKPRAVFQNSNIKIGVGLHPNHNGNFPICVVDGNGENPQRIYHQEFKPTKEDVGLGLVSNYPATSDVESNSDEILATTALVSNTRALMVYTGKDFIIGGNANTYYPVRIKVNSNLSFAFWNISISRQHGTTAPGNIWNPQLPTHPGGLTLSMRWTGAGAWNGQDTNLRIIQFYETYSTMVARVEVLKDSMCVWLRGGGASYKINSDVGKNLEYEVFLYGFADIDSNRYEPIQQYSEETVRNTIMSRYPVRNTGELYVGNNPVYHAGNLPKINTTQYGTSNFMRGKGPISDEWIELNVFEKYLPVENYPKLEGILDKKKVRQPFDFGNLQSNNDPRFTITPLTTGGTITNPELLYKLFSGGLSYGEEIVLEVTEPLNPDLQLGFELSGELWEEIKNISSLFFLNFYCAIESGLGDTTSSTKTIQPIEKTFFGYEAVDKWYITNNILQPSKFRIKANGLINNIFDICEYTADGTDSVKKITFGEGSRIEIALSNKEMFVVPKKLDLPTREIMYIGKPSGEEN